MKRNTMKEFSETVMASLKNIESTKDVKWVKPWRTIDSTYRNAISNRPYSGLHNILVCLLSDFDDPRYMTFNQIRKAGWKVKKGSNATRLIAWKFFKKKDENTGEEKSIPFATQWCLFNAEQIEGHDLEPLNLNVIDETMKPNEDVLNIFQKLNVNFKHHVTNTAAYFPVSDVIEIPDVKLYSDVDSWAVTCIHELIHWTSHKDRVNRNCNDYHFDVESRAMEELVAELGSMYICMRLKINGAMDTNNMAYIAEWKKAAHAKNGDKFFYKACKLAEEAAKYILKNSGYMEEETEEKEDAA